MPLIQLLLARKLLDDPGRRDHLLLLLLLLILPQLLVAQPIAHSIADSLVLLSRAGLAKFDGRARKERCLAMSLLHSQLQVPHAQLVK